MRKRELFSFDQHFPIRSYFGARSQFVFIRREIEMPLNLYTLDLALKSPNENNARVPIIKRFSISFAWL